ncbi:MAG: purine-binding chemotaxis protein CheW [Methanomicrobiales archaeon]|nr:purine-binding chemotaxis protein CheW [Methanomicrobiales archaeon]
MNGKSSGEVLEFSLGSENYALDINLVREIVEMMPITAIPRAPVHIRGVINLRGEIVNIVNLNTFLKLPDRPVTKDQKIIVLMAEVAGGNNVGIIVDNVSSVTEISADQVDCMTESIAGNESRYIKGIITSGQDTGTNAAKNLIIWLDIHKMFKDLEKK